MVAEIFALVHPLLFATTKQKSKQTNKAKKKSHQNPSNEQTNQKLNNPQSQQLTGETPQAAAATGSQREQTLTLPPHGYLFFPQKILHLTKRDQCQTSFLAGALPILLLLGWPG